MFKDKIVIHVNMFRNEFSAEYNDREKTFDNIADMMSFLSGYKGKEDTVTIDLVGMEDERSFT